MTVRKPLVIVAGQVQEMPAGDSVAVSYNGGTDPIIASFSGPVSVATGASRYYHPSTTTIVGAYASLGTASSSSSVVAVVNLNGVLLTTLTITATNNLLSPVTLDQAITPSDYLTIDVTDAGTGATDLTVYLVVEAAGGAGGAANIDGGFPASKYGGTEPIDGGTP